MKRRIIFSCFLQIIIILGFGSALSCSGGSQKTGQEESSDKEGSIVSAEEWITLFDGKTLNGWKRYNADEIGPLWRVDNGTILCDGEGHGEAFGDFRGSLITTEIFGNFELELEWRISKGGNSGILYHVVEKPEYSTAYMTGPEYQINDETPGDPEAAQSRKSTATNYDMYAAPNKKLNPTMEWNSSKIIYNEGKVEHWLNGDKVVEFDENTEDFKARYAESKWASEEYPGWNKYKEGSIGLQDHGAQVWYRNIRIKKL